MREWVDSPIALLAPPGTVRVLKERLEGLRLRQAVFILAAACRGRGRIAKALYLEADRLNRGERLLARLRAPRRDARQMGLALSTGPDTLATDWRELLRSPGENFDSQSSRSLRWSGLLCSLVDAESLRE